MRGFVASSSGNLSTTNSPAPAPAAKGPATDRLSAMKEAFKAQYMNQVSRKHCNFFSLLLLLLQLSLLRVKRIPRQYNPKEKGVDGSKLVSNCNINHCHRTWFYCLNK